MAGKEREPQPRGVYFAVVGPVGVGKSFFSNLVAQRFGMACQEESFLENPFLKGFYEEDERKYSFDCQISFLAVRSVRTRSLRNVLLSRSVVQDADTEVDGIIADVHRRLRFMSEEEYGVYRRARNKQIQDPFFPRVDVHIALTAEPETVERRIIERGREMEIKMHDRNPTYYRTIVEVFNEWLAENRWKTPMVVIDTDRHDFILDPEAREWALEEIGNWGRYYLTHPHQLDGKGRDGAKLLIPDSILLPRMYKAGDVTPGLAPEQKLLSGR